VETSTARHRWRSVHQRDRAVFVSDVHLGTRGTQAAKFLRFLKALSCDHLYLIGDIVDFHGMPRRWHWEGTHGEILAELLAIRARGTRVTYIPGNHDWFVRGYEQLDIGGVKVARKAVHETADGRRFLLVHGDEFDRAGRLATILADAVVEVVGAVARVGNGIRRAAGFPWLPLASKVRHAAQHLVPHVARFEAAAAAEARRLGVDGIICGHLHLAAMKLAGGTLYCNTGDWVDSCTAIREDRGGRLALVDHAGASGRVQVSEDGAPEETQPHGCVSTKAG
jgi:UDP-2,3-diacylglucosamine pyrophosphatase LpxH